jgi:glutamate 5-kinase
MLTKLQAADLARRSGTTVVIAAGDEENVLTRLARGEKLGTRFSALASTLEGRKRYILAGGNHLPGILIVDAGAALALRKGSSLLPVGVKGVTGEFDCGDTVKVVDSSGSEVARGLVNYSAADLARIAGKQSGEIEAILGSDYDDEVIHRNNLVLI